MRLDSFNIKQEIRVCVCEREMLEREREVDRETEREREGGIRETDLE